MNYILNHLLTGEKEHYFLKNASNMPLEHFCCEPNLDSFHHPTIVETSLSFLKNAKNRERRLLYSKKNFE